MSAFGSSAYVLADEVTGIKYSIIVENARIMMKQVSDNEKSSRIILTDTITRKNYNLSIINEILTIIETTAIANSGKIIVPDLATGLYYQVIISNKHLAIIETEVDINNILELVDGSKISYNVIFGGPANVNGITRDVLSIEINPDTATIDELNRFFANKDNLKYLYIYEKEQSEDGYVYDRKIEIGEGYTILVGIDEVTRKVNPFPGKIVPDVYETIYIVKLAQMTYNEWVSSGYASDN